MVSFLSTFIISLLLRFFFGVVILVDGICSWSDFCSMIVCFTFAGNTGPFFERYILSHLDACSNKVFICWSLDLFAVSGTILDLVDD